MSSITKYPTGYDAVENDSLNYTEWVRLQHLTNNTNNSAVGYYSGNDVPQQLYLYDFEVGLEEYQNIKSVTFEIEMTGSPGLDVNAPTLYVNYGRNIGHNNLEFTNTIKLECNKRVSNYKSTYTYTLSQTDIIVNKLTRDMVNSALFGAILSFPSKTSTNSGYIQLNWVRVNVEYESPIYYFGSDKPLYSDKYSSYYSGLHCHTWFKGTIHISNGSFWLGGGSELKVDLPAGLDIKSANCTRCTWDGSTNTLNLLNEGKSGECHAEFEFYATTSGYKQIVFHGENIGSWTVWTYINKHYAGEVGADAKFEMTTNTCRKGAESILTFDGVTVNEDGTANFEISIGKDGFYNPPYKIIANLDHCDKQVTVGKIDVGNGLINFNVPKNKEVKISFDAYFIPKSIGEWEIELNNLDNQDRLLFYCNVEYPYSYKFNFNCKDTLIEGGRVTTTIGTGAYILPCRSVDSTIKVKKPSLEAKKFEDVDYIGCVKLKQTHYSPKSTFKDTLLNTTYKNKRYMGKKGSIDEDITLKVRLPPVDVTTVQGMIEMDKPIPIDANHLCFEGDALNHRGWAEIYSIKTDPVGNNSLWYDCDIDVKYLTHNISSRFKINKGSRVSDYFLPNLLTPSFESGGDMGDVFDCDSTGIVSYNGDNVDVNRRNIVVLDESEYAKLRSREKLKIKCKATLNWASTVNTESRDNHVSRIVRLIDGNSGNTVFEYEYYDFTHDGEDHSCRVIGRLLYKDAYKVIINRRINLYNDTTETSKGTPLFGSELQFRIMSNLLTIQDSGWSGKELYLEDISLESGEYYLEVEIINENSDLDASPIIHYLNYELMDLVISNEYNTHYQNLLVSPFPVPDKDIIYTRDSEDGTIFYLEDDGSECTYLLSPYYQYHTGVSLESLEGIQLINLENNHNVLYITNGLIRVGLNRLNGKVSLYKYDRVSKQYILVSKLQLTKYEDMNINSFTDDKIELQVSDSIFTVWRGRPFVRVSHPTEDINFKDRFTSIYAERVGDNTSEYPTTYKLVDESNLLPTCLGSKRVIKSDCVDVDSEEFTPSYTNLSLQLLNTNNKSVSKLGISQPCRFKVWSGNLNPIEEISFVVDGEMIPAKVYLDTAAYTSGQAPNYIEYTFDEIGKHRVQAIWSEVDGYDYAISSELTINVYDDSYSLTPLFADEMYYGQGTFDFLLTSAGSPASAGKVVNITANGLDYPKATNSKGIVSLNNNLPAGDYVISANFCKAMADTSVSSYDPSKITVIDARASKSVKIRKAYTKSSVVNSSGTSITTANVKKGTYVICKLTDSSNKALANNVITLTVNGVTYTRVTDADGCARLNINLMANTYDLQVSFAGTNQYQGLVKNYELVVVD